MACDGKPLLVPALVAVDAFGFGLPLCGVALLLLADFALRGGRFVTGRIVAGSFNGVSAFALSRCRAFARSLAFAHGLRSPAAGNRRADYQDGTKSWAILSALRAWPIVSSRALPETIRWSHETIRQRHETTFPVPRNHCETLAC
jgi:hypothetical protein